MTFGYNRLMILGLVVATLVFLVSRVWRLWSLKSNAASKPLRAILALLSMSFLVFMLWVAWQFQPWMPAGKAVHVSSSHIGDYEFQIWQRKNGWLMATEPFATGLFVRKQSGQWKAFLLDFEDAYRPTITLQEHASRVAVLYGSNVRGYFDEAQQVFKRNYEGEFLPIEATLIDSEPPGKWWLEETNKK